MCLDPSDGRLAELLRTARPGASLADCRAELLDAGYSVAGEGEGFALRHPDGEAAQVVARVQLQS
jgi:hypothetical protein